MRDGLRLLVDGGRCRLPPSSTLLAVPLPGGRGHKVQQDSQADAHVGSSALRWTGVMPSTRPAGAGGALEPREGVQLLKTCGAMVCCRPLRPSFILQRGSGGHALLRRGFQASQPSSEEGHRPTQPSSTEGLRLLELSPGEGSWLHQSAKHAMLTKLSPSWAGGSYPGRACDRNSPTAALGRTCCASGLLALPYPLRWRRHSKCRNQARARGGRGGWARLRCHENGIG